MIRSMNQQTTSVVLKTKRNFHCRCTYVSIKSDKVTTISASVARPLPLMAISKLHGELILVQLTAIHLLGLKNGE